MTQYNPLKTLPYIESTSISSSTAPLLVHDDDPAIDIMTDLQTMQALRIKMSDTIDTIGYELQSHDVHALLVVKEEQTVVGIVTSEDVFGEKPITITQESRMPRNTITAKMLMTPIEQILTFNISDILSARVGNIVATLAENKALYAIAISNSESSEIPALEGFFNYMQIRKQRHTDLTSPTP